MTKKPSTYFARIDVEPFVFKQDPIDFENALADELTRTFLDLQKFIINDYHKKRLTEKKESNDALTGDK